MSKHEHRTLDSATSPTAWVLATVSAVFGEHQAVGPGPVSGSCKRLVPDRALGPTRARPRQPRTFATALTKFTSSSRTCRGLGTPTRAHRRGQSPGPGSAPRSRSWPPSGSQRSGDLATGASRARSSQTTVCWFVTSAKLTGEDVGSGREQFRPRGACDHSWQSSVTEGRVRHRLETRARSPLAASRRAE